MLDEISAQRIREEHHRADHQCVEPLRDVKCEMEIRAVESEAEDRRIEHGRIVHDLPGHEEWPVRHERAGKLPVHQLVAEDARLHDGQRREPSRGGECEPEPGQLHQLSAPAAHTPPSSDVRSAPSGCRIDTKKPISICSTVSRRKSAESASARSAA